MSAIRAIDVTKKYRKGAIALRGLDLEVAEGEIFGLLGPNGAGKTTFVKCLLDLIRPTTGKIELFGGPPEHADRRALVGFDILLRWRLPSLHPTRIPCAEGYVPAVTIIRPWSG